MKVKNCLVFEKQGSYKTFSTQKVFRSPKLDARKNLPNHKLVHVTSFQK